jgi:CubicO group peptidase (beta-lactamase class C family)
VPLSAWLLLLAVVVACAGCAGSSAAQRQPTATVSPLAAQVDAYLTQQLEAQRFSGAVLLAQGDTVLLSKGYGMASVALQAPNTPDTQFRIASLTKQFTATAILLLQTRGTLHVQDSVCRYIGDCPRAWQPITIQELLTHTSGIVDLPDDAIADYTKPLTSQQLLALIRARPLAFAPGTRFSYSSAGYNVLGAIVESVSGAPYATFLQREVFTRLGLTRTQYDASAIQPPAHAQGYTSWRTPAPYLDMALPFAAGGVASTVGDLYHWSRALDTAGTASPLPPDALADLFAARVPLCPVNGASCPGSFTRLAYGYGWYVGADVLGRVEYHPGDLLGFRSLLARYPDRNLTLVVLSNLETVDIGALQAALEARILTNGA